jgi:hypothetical protein
LLSRRTVQAHGAVNVVVHSAAHIHTDCAGIRNHIRRKTVMIVSQTRIRNTDNYANMDTSTAESSCILQ